MGAYKARKMNDTTYFVIVRMIDWCYWRGKLQGSENLPGQGPAVFIANHLGPKGPIGAVCSIPLRFYPWIIADMVDKQTAADYLKKDFVEPSLRLKPPLSTVVARMISFVSVWLLTAIGCVPINRQDYDELQDSLQSCMTLLKDKKILFICPEDSEGGYDPHTKTRTFLKGFTRLGELFYYQTGQLLNFYPVAIHESKVVMVGKPVRFDPDNPHSMERLRLKKLLENKIKDMYLGMDKEQ